MSSAALRETAGNAAGPTANAQSMTAFVRRSLAIFLPADGFIAATPVYWYGMSSQLKAFFDRMFCYVAASHPQSAAVVERMTGKRIGLLLS